MSSTRTDKFDEKKIQEDIALIQQVCTGVDLESISLLFHECEYDIQQTIARIDAGDFQDIGWQTAKTTHRKKASQPRPIRSNPVVVRRSTPPSAVPPPPPVPLVVENVENVEKIPSVSSVCSSPMPVEEKTRIPTKPVTIYRALELTSFPTDIRFGDIQWNDDGPFAVTPQDLITEQQLSSTTDFISQPDSTTNQNEQISTAPAPAFVPFNSTANSTNSNSYKTTAKTSPNYSTQPPVYHLGNFAPSIVPIVMSFDSWSNNGYTQPLDNYSYAPTNYLPATYSNPQHFYPPQKFDSPNFDRDFFSTYGQTNVDPSANSTKENPMKSRLSATAAAFPPPYSLPTYSYQIGQTHFSSIDGRDHRQTSSYNNSNANHRSNYHSHRTYPNNQNNWHSQQ